MNDLKIIDATNLDYKIQKCCLGSEILLKLPCMRKIDDFSIYPTNYDDKFIYLQSENKCIKINKEDATGIFSNKGSMPMDYFLTFKPSYKVIFNKKIVDDILAELNNNKNYKKNSAVAIIGV